MSRVPDSDATLLVTALRSRWAVMRQAARTILEEAAREAGTREEMARFLGVSRSSLFKILAAAAEAVAEESAKRSKKKSKK